MSSKLSDKPLQQIKLKHNDSEILFPLNKDGYADIRQIKKIYFKAIGLSYDCNGTPAMAPFLEGDDHLIIVKIPSVQRIPYFNVHIGEGEDSAKHEAQNKASLNNRKRLADQMLDQIKFLDDDAFKKKKKSKKNKDSDSEENSPKSEGKKSGNPPKRICHLQWRHQTFQDSEFELKDKAIIYLNYSHDYSFKEIEKELIGAFKSTDKGDFYFSTAAKVQIGTSETENKVITDFKNEKGKSIQFWALAKILREKDAGKRLKLYVFTTMVASTGPSKSKNKNSVLNEVSVNSLEKSMIVEKVSAPQKENSPLKKIYKVDAAVQVHSDSINSAGYENRFHSFNESGCFKNNDSSANSNSESSSVYNKSREVPNNFKNVSSQAGNSQAGNSFSKESDTFSKGLASESCNKEIDGSFKKPAEVNTYQTIIDEKLANYNINLLKIDEKDLKFSSIVLGQGAQGVVKKAEVSGSTVAVKTLPLKKFDMLLFREIAIMEKVRHDNFINIMAICANPKQFHIIMQYCNGMSLHQMIFEIPEKHLDLETKNKVGLQICQGLNYIHKLKDPIIHRDIKPSNIMVDSYNNVKICDLGLAKSKDMCSRLQTTQAGRIRGTIVYLAPEILLRNQEATTKSDVWAAALTLTELYTYQASYEIPAYSFDLFGIMKNYFQNRTIPELQFVPVFLRAAIKTCYKFDTDQRCDIDHVLVAYSFITKLQNMHGSCSK